MSNLFTNMQRKQHQQQQQRSETAASVNAEATQAEAEEEDDALANILSLKLKKPKHWKWELTTSRSCTNIALPRILLYDHKGQLLVDANSQSEQVYKQQVATPQKTRKRSNKAATANLAQTIRQALDSDFDGLRIAEATPSPTPTPERSTPRLRFPSPAATIDTNGTSGGSAVDFFTNDLPDYKFERRSNSLKGVRFKVDDDVSKKDASLSSFHVIDLPTPPSTTTTTTTATASSSSGPREKRRYRRSHSSGRSPASNSESILERFSYNKGRYSSPEYAAAHEVTHAPRYYLCTSKAGTLVVQKESFSRYRRRLPRPRNSSSENIQKDSSRSTSSLKLAADATRQSQQLQVEAQQPQCGSLQNIAELQKQTLKKAVPVRRYRSDGNILLHRELSTSDEDVEQAQAVARQQRRYANLRRQSKKDLIGVQFENVPDNATAS